ncbi:hypothetical protein CYMTET_25946 [Cymbomonas tetramitiformis]|uniref:Rab3-GAP regulatory subunit N-terminal domain-containing protein n=1 Tax=Cymbomonas tetramitiformis TaxID=36881 RepID=A0AAE0FSR1_9CHLO|nr:hypothetical protein CYMTET_25946 [Cymbomonas tetramitiformis]
MDSTGKEPSDSKAKESANSSTKCLIRHGELEGCEKLIAFLFDECLDDPVLQYSNTWLEDQDLKIALSADGRRMAVARGRRLALFNLLQNPGERLEPRYIDDACNSSESITDITWIAFVGSASQPKVFVDECILVGTSAGRVGFYSASGKFLQSQRFHTTEVIRLRVRGGESGPCRGDATEDLTVLYTGALVRLDAFDLQSCVRRWQVLGAGQHESELQVRKWELPKWKGSVCLDGVCAGPFPPLLDNLLTSSSDAPVSDLCLLTVGCKPAMMAYSASETDDLGVVALASKVVGSMGSAVFGLANSVASSAKHAASGRVPVLGSWLGSALGAASATASAASAARPQSEAEKHDVRPGEEAALEEGGRTRPWRAVQDGPRRVTSLRLAPRGSMAASTDSLGRVCLLDTASPFTLVRMWKGYRKASIAWLEDSNEASHGEPQQLLAVLAPMRGGLLEIWQLRRGQCVARAKCGNNCQLLEAARPFGAAMSVTRGSSEQDLQRVIAKAFIVHGSGQVEAVGMPDLPDML